MTHIHKKYMIYIYALLYTCALFLTQDERHRPYISIYTHIIRKIIITKKEKNYVNACRERETSNITSNHAF